MSSINLPFFGQNDPWTPQQDPTTGNTSVNVPTYGDYSGSGGGTTPSQPNALAQWLQRLRKMQNQGGPGAGGPAPYSPVTTASQIGQLGGMGLGLLANKFADGTDDGTYNDLGLPTDTPAVFGEAGPEQVTTPDGMSQTVTTPQAGVLPAGTKVHPLTPKPHRTTRQGKKLLGRLSQHGVKVRKFADGTDDDDTFDGSDLAYGPQQPTGPVGPTQEFDPSSPDSLFSGPNLTSPEAPPMSPEQLIDKTSATPSASDLGQAPQSPSEAIRSKLAALQMPAPGKPSLLQRIGSAALGGLSGAVNTRYPRMRPIDPSGAEQNILYPGYANQMRQYQIQRANLQNQLQQAQGNFSDQAQNAALQHLQAQTGQVQAQTAAIPGAQVMGALEHGFQLSNPDQTVNVGGTPMRMPTPAEKAEMEGKIIPVPKILQQTYGLPAKAPYQTVDAVLRLAETKAQQESNATLRKQLQNEAEQARAQIAADANDTRLAVAGMSQGKTADNRSDKSYEYNNNILEKTQQPIDQLQQRMGRLLDTIHSGTPQADALTAPELMTVMAGGMGSGIRINEAEINRVLQGRSKWEDIKAAINKWSFDPKKANSIPASQRAQILDLVNYVNSKMLAKQGILQDARQSLIDSDDPKVHRQIVANAKKKLQAIDQGNSPNEFAAPGVGPAVGTIKNGYRYKGGNPSDQNSWEPVQQGGK